MTYHSCRGLVLVEYYHLGSTNCQLGKSVSPACVLGVLEICLGVKVDYFATNLAGVVAGIHCLNQADTAFPCNQAGPKGLKVVPHWRNDSHPGDDNTAVGHNNLK